MYNAAPIEVAEAKAKEIAESSRGGPRRNVILFHCRKWYDIRHMTDVEIMAFVCGLTGRRPERLN